MATTEPQPASKLPRWAVWLGPVAGMATIVFSAFRKTERLDQALIDTMVPVGAVVVLIALAALVERLFSGRARLWARIAEISIVIGVVVFGVAIANGSTFTLILASSFWLFVTGALVLLAALRPEVTT